MPSRPSGVVASVHVSPVHEVAKATVGSIMLIKGHGVKGDAHFGTTVQHLSRVRQDPKQPNLRQVHLIGGELFDELADTGFEISPGRLGENITTSGIVLLELPVGTRLALGHTALVELTGLRNPCVQLNGVSPGLMTTLVHLGPDGELIRRAGVMGIVLVSGSVMTGDPIRVELPAEPHRRLERV